MFSRRDGVLRDATYVYPAWNKDCPTGCSKLFFFNLERSVAQGRQMLCLRHPGSRVNTSFGEMRNHGTDFYDDLFRAE